MEIGGHFGGGDHFDGGDHFGGGTGPMSVKLNFRGGSIYFISNIYSAYFSCWYSAAKVNLPPHLKVNLPLP